MAMQEVPEAKTLHKFTMAWKQLAKDGKWIAEAVKVRSDDLAEIDTQSKELLRIANERLVELNKDKTE